MEEKEAENVEKTIFKCKLDGEDDWGQTIEMRSNVELEIR